MISTQNDQKGKLIGDYCNFDSLMPSFLSGQFSPCLTQFIRPTMLEHAWVLGVNMSF